MVKDTTISNTIALDWFCEYCGNYNTADAYKCQGCSAPRSDNSDSDNQCEEIHQDPSIIVNAVMAAEMNRFTMSAAVFSTFICFIMIVIIIYLAIL